MTKMTLTSSFLRGVPMIWSKTQEAALIVATAITTTKACDHVPDAPFYPRMHALSQCVSLQMHSFTYRRMISIYRISSIRHLGINQQIVCCVPDINRSRGINLNIEFSRCLERITSAPPSVQKSRGIKNV